MHISFKYRFILSFVVLEVLFLAMIVYINFNNINNSYQNFITYKEESLKSLGSQLLATPVSIYDLATIDNVVDEFMNLGGIAWMSVEDSKGNIISQPKEGTKHSKDRPKEHQNSKIKQISQSIIIEKVMIGKFDIWVDLEADMATIDKNREQTFGIILFEILLSTFLSWLVGHKIAQNLNILTQSAQNLSKNLNTKIPKLSGAKEIEILADTLEKMRTDLLLDRYELEHYKQIVDKDVMISRTDLEGFIQYASSAFCKISGYSEQELIGKNHNFIRHPDTNPNIYEGLWDAISKNNTWHGEMKNLRKDGTFYWVDTSISPWFDINANKIGYIAVRQDITDKKLIEQLSITDGLTQIYNRRHFNDLFPRMINSAKRNNELLSFLILDIDHFKQYNDTYGHKMGDDALVAVAQTIKNCLKRSNDYCFRLGGEEFGVIYVSQTIESSIEFAQTIRKNIENLGIEHAKNSASKYVSISAGLVCKNANEIKNMDEIYALADKYLYLAKESGRNKVVNG